MGGQKLVGGACVWGMAAAFGAALLAPIVAHAYRPIYGPIPSFSELVGSSDLIVQGTVIRIVPALSYFVPFALYGAGFAVIVALLSWRRLKTAVRIAVIAGIFFILGILAAHILRFDIGAFRKVAVIEVEEVLKGDYTGSTGFIYYDTAIHKGVPSFERGKEYVAFLRLRGSVYTTPWSCWLWEVTPEGTITELMRLRDIPPVKLSDFVKRIRGIMEDPADPEFSDIYTDQQGRISHYPITMDPFFDPETREWLEERKRAEEDDSAESDTK